MNAFSKRYFILILMIFLLFLFAVIKGALLVSVAFSFLASVICLVFRKRIGGYSKKLKALIILAIVASLLGGARGELLILKNKGLVEKYSGERVIEGYMLDSSVRYPYMSESIIRIERIDGERVNICAVMVTDFSLELEEGDFFSANTKFIELAAYEDAKLLRNNNEYDYPLICTLGSEEDITPLPEEFRPRIALLKLNARWSGALRVILRKNVGDLASALLLGNREHLSDSILRDFRRAGVYHMLALSGMHVAILIGLLDRLLRKLCVLPIPRIIVLTGASLFYIALTGFQLSSCRALIMLWIVYLSSILHGSTDTMTSLFVAASVISFISPSALLDVGFQLSFASTFGVIASSFIQRRIAFFRYGTFRGIKGKLLFLFKKLLAMNLSSACVLVSTLPLLTVYFGEISLATFFSNIVIGAMCEAFLLFALLALVLSEVAALGTACAFVANTVGRIMLIAVERISDVENVTASLMYPGTGIIVTLAFFFSLLFFAIKLKRKWLLAMPCLVFGLIFTVNAYGFELSRSCSTVSEFVLGDSIVLSSSEGVYICDSSNGRYGNFYNALLLAKENCKTEIDGVILTHYHSYHDTSLKRLASNFTIRAVYLPMPQNARESADLSSIVLALNGSRTRVYVFDTEQGLDILGGRLKLSRRAYGADYSHPSVALSYSFGNSRISYLCRPYFGSYLDREGSFDFELGESDLVIFGSNGHTPQNSFEIFYKLKEGAQIVFCDREHMLLSDFEPYLSSYKIYVDTSYKKYVLK